MKDSFWSAVFSGYSVAMAACLFGEFSKISVLLVFMCAASSQDTCEPPFAAVPDGFLHKPQDSISWRSRKRWHQTFERHQNSGEWCCADRRRTQGRSQTEHRRTLHHLPLPHSRGQGERNPCLQGYPDHHFTGGWQPAHCLWGKATRQAKRWHKQLCAGIPVQRLRGERWRRRSLQHHFGGKRRWEQHPTCLACPATTPSGTNQKLYRSLSCYPFLYNLIHLFS